MKGLKDRLPVWGPRVLGVAMSLFLAMFALDAFGPGQGFWQAVPHFLIHLVPALIVLLVVAVGWRWDWLGGAGCLALAAVYAAWAQRLDWVFVISGPMALVGLLFLWSAYHRWRLPKQSQ